MLFFICALSVIFKRAKTAMQGCTISQLQMLKALKIALIIKPQNKKEIKIKYSYQNLKLIHTSGAYRGCVQNIMIILCVMS